MCQIQCKEKNKSHAQLLSSNSEVEPYMRKTATRSGGMSLEWVYQNPLFERSTFLFAKPSKYIKIK